MHTQPQLKDTFPFFSSSSPKAKAVGAADAAAETNTAY